MKADKAMGKEAGWSKLFHIVVDRGVWAQLSGKARAVYIVLHRHVDDVTRICWPSIELIAREAGIHVRNVSAALAELEQWHLIKRWRKDRKNFYRLYPADMLKDLLPQKMDVSRSPRKMDVSPLRKRRNVLGRFMPASAMDEPAPSLVERSHPPAMETVAPPPVEPKENSLRRVPEEDPKKEKQAGSASASSKASAEPAAAAREYIEYLIPGKLTRSSFYYNQRMNRAHKKPTPEQIRWLKTCVRLTDEEIQGLFAAEYPDWKPAQNNGTG